MGMTALHFVSARTGALVHEVTVFRSMPEAVVAARSLVGEGVAVIVGCRLVGRELSRVVEPGPSGRVVDRSATKEERRDGFVVAPGTTRRERILDIRREAAGRARLRIRTGAGDRLTVGSDGEVLEGSREAPGRLAPDEREADAAALG